MIPHLGRRADGEGMPLGGAQPGEGIIILVDKEDIEAL